ncbi:MAG: protein jag [Oscillospiraceae bacterium]|nr:protein jag [Oscillospiraceae bacterium]
MSINNELIISGDNVDIAIEKGCKQLGLSKDDVTIEIIEKEQKSLFGKLKSPASVRLISKISDSFGSNKGAKAKAYLTKILSVMDIGEFDVSMEETEEAALIELNGENIDEVVGRHGETLDAIQYLSSLVANAGGGDYYKITIDCKGFRKKREQELAKLASSVAAVVKRTGNSSTLESMNPFERRVVHAAISKIEGVSSRSIGEEPNRKIVVTSDRVTPGGRYSGRRPAFPVERKPRSEPSVPKGNGDIYSFEKGFKKQESKEEKLAKLYSKIDIEE